MVSARRGSISQRGRKQTAQASTLCAPCAILYRIQNTCRFLTVGCIQCCLGNTAAQAFTACGLGCLWDRDGCAGQNCCISHRISHVPTPSGQLPIPPDRPKFGAERKAGGGTASSSRKANKHSPLNPSPIPAPSVCGAASLKLAELSGKGNETPSSWQEGRQTHG